MYAHCCTKTFLGTLNYNELEPTVRLVKNYNWLRNMEGDDPLYSFYTGKR